jgi:hypothetical protein
MNSKIKSQTKEIEKLTDKIKQLKKDHEIAMFNKNGELL